MSGPAGPSAHDPSSTPPEDGDATQTDIRPVQPSPGPSAPESPAEPGGYARPAPSGTSARPGPPAEPARPAEPGPTEQAGHPTPWGAAGPAPDPTEPFVPQPGATAQAPAPGPTTQAPVGGTTVSPSSAHGTAPRSYHQARTQEQALPYDPAAAPSYEPGPAEHEPHDPHGDAASLFGGSGQGGEFEESSVDHEEPRRRGGLGGPIAVIALSLLVLGLALVLTLRGGGDEKADRSTPLPTATQTASPPVAPSVTQVPTDQVSSPSPTPWTQTSTPAAPSSTQPSSASPTSTTPKGTLPDRVKKCGADVGASKTTTCPFANRVADAVRAVGPQSGDFTVGARSEATKKDYVMRCKGGPVTVCRGGKSAVVYVV